MNTITIRDANSGTRTLEIPHTGASLREVLNENAYAYNEQTQFYFNDPATGNRRANLNDVAMVGGSYTCMVPAKAG